MDNNKEALKTLVEELLKNLMGEALDCSRMAVPNDRQFQQLERTLRVKTRQLISDGKKLIDESSS